MSQAQAAPAADGAVSKDKKYTVVIKVGTSSLVRPGRGGLNMVSLAGIVEVVADLRAAGHAVVVVSSGAVGVGCERLRLADRPAELPKKQALAAIGQVHLMRYYEDLFGAAGLTCAQVLLTLDNLASRSQYLCALATFRELLAYGAVPVVNENDTVAVDQLRIGDNDTLSAQVATLVRADWLFLLTDVDALYTADPRSDPGAAPIRVVPDLAALRASTGGGAAGSRWGTGGMATKLTAARIATAAGCRMVIAHFSRPADVARALAGEPVGTLFLPAPAPARGRKRWILSVPVRGEVALDAGAVRAVRDRRKSLFPAGVLAAAGGFAAQDAVRLTDAAGREFARALCNYSCDEVRRGAGLGSDRFAAAVGYAGAEEVVHRANVCLLAGGAGGGAGDGGDDDSDGDGAADDDDRAPPAAAATPPPDAEAAALAAEMQALAPGP